ncbi:ABC-type transport auxiliary lipoprotein family protein [Paeniroseomonas aquatica]|uniref:ABC-type transport auxiliary lipoprotein family protein n=1 Tax=Paeniroseomonas aquatica TaxID=373043 RepID=UPI00360CA340
MQRFALAPERPQRATPARGAPVLLVRTLRAAPGLDVRGLRLLGADGQITTEYWQEWAAPPADLAEEALRRWLAASGRFSAVTLPGSRLRSDLVLEAELIRLQAEPGSGLGRAALSVLALAEAQSGSGEARILGQFLAEGAAPLARQGSKVRAADAATAMSAALGLALAQVEQRLAGLPAPRRVA